MSEEFDVIVIGAGAAGLFYSLLASRNKQSILLIEKNLETGKKILVSGGGRCNYTNESITTDNFQTDCPKKMNRILKQYDSKEVVRLFKSFGIEPILKSKGQLFSSRKAKGLRDALLEDISTRNVKIKKNCEVKLSDIDLKSDSFKILIKGKNYLSSQLVIATGGLSFPALGISHLGYEIAKKLNISVTNLKPGLVPINVKKPYGKLAGLSCEAKICYNKKEYIDDILFTHKGFSGPGILKISSFLDSLPNLNKDLNKERTTENIIKLNFLFRESLQTLVDNERIDDGKKEIKSLLKNKLPSKLVDFFFEKYLLSNKKIAEIKKSEISKIKNIFEHFEIVPETTQGYPKAEVTVGGVKIDQLDDHLQSKKLSGLFFIGEVCDVTGDLGGFNFQWAWTSAYLASQICKSN